MPICRGVESVAKVNIVCGGCPGSLFHFSARRTKCRIACLAYESVQALSGPHLNDQSRFWQNGGWNWPKSTKMNDLDREISCIVTQVPPHQRTDEASAMVERAQVRFIRQLRIRRPNFVAERSNDRFSRRKAARFVLLLPQISRCMPAQHKNPRYRLGSLPSSESFSQAKSTKQGPMAPLRTKRI